MEIFLYRDYRVISVYFNHVYALGNSFTRVGNSDQLRPNSDCELLTPE